MNNITTQVAQDVKLPLADIQIGLESNPHPVRPAQIFSISLFLQSLASCFANKLTAVSSE